MLFPYITVSFAAQALSQVNFALGVIIVSLTATEKDCLVVNLKVSSVFVFPLLLHKRIWNFSIQYMLYM